MIYEITNRFSGAVIYSADTVDMRTAVIQVLTANGSLRCASLIGVDLNKVSFQAADLRKVNLYMANLSGAYLIGADLREANLQEANLNNADLRRANLCNANLKYANLRGARLTLASLIGADLSSTDLTDAEGIRAPIVPHIDAAILEAITDGSRHLDMGTWHTCTTTHCRAGWAIHLAGDSGYALEDRVGPNAAGALIYAASRPGQPVPDFFAPVVETLRDLREHAARSPLPAVATEND